MTDDIKTHFKVGKQNLLCKIRCYYVKSQGFLSKNTPFFGFKCLHKPVKCLKKDPFSREIQNDDMYPMCQTMTLSGWGNEQF